MKYLPFILILLLGCATKKEVTKLKGDLQMLNSINQRMMETKERTFGMSPKPLPTVPPLPQNISPVVYVFTNANSRMQADPEWLKTINGTDYWADRESVRRMNNRMEGIEMILRGSKLIEENR